MLLGPAPSWPWEELGRVALAGGVPGVPTDLGCDCGFVLLYSALLDMPDDLSQPTSSLVSKLLTLLSNEDEELVSRFKLRLLRFRLHRACRRLRSRRGIGWLCCCSSAED